MNYKIIGVMTGTSMDGLDCSYLETNGDDFVKIIKEKSFIYDKKYRNSLRKLIDKKPENKKDQIKYFKDNERFVTKKIIDILKKFISYIQQDNKNIDFISYSGQTVFHNPKKKYSIQIGSSKEINRFFLIPVISNFRENDLVNGGQGAPIGSFYHGYILKKITNNSAIINLGGICNITYYDKKNLISFDMGPANTIIDNLMNFFYRKKFDEFGKVAKKGKKITSVFKEFKSDIYFKKEYPKSLDIDYFSKYVELLKKYNPEDALYTATMMTSESIFMGIKLLKKNIKTIVLTGGGRKNNFLLSNVIKRAKKLNIIIMKIDDYGYDGDLLEAQMFGYLGIRSYKKMIISTPLTTGVKKKISGGKIYR